MSWFKGVDMRRIEHTDIISGVTSASNENYFLFDISFKDFKDIFKFDFKKNLKNWHKIYTDNVKALTNEKKIYFEYPPEYSIQDNSLRAHIYDWSKYHYFAHAGLKTYKVPLNVLILPNGGYLIHPGNARLNCMSWWEDDYRVKITITDNNTTDLIFKLREKSNYCYNFQNENDWPEIINELDLNNWSNTFIRHSILGYEIGEQHCKLKEFSQSYTIEYTEDLVIVNDKVILYTNELGEPCLNHYK